MGDSIEISFTTTRRDQVTDAIAVVMRRVHGGPAEVPWPTSVLGGDADRGTAISAALGGGIEQKRRNQRRAQRRCPWSRQTCVVSDESPKTSLVKER